MRNNIIKLALSVAAVVALPGAALAGTSTATNSATFNVVNQCAVTGSTVNLGTYTSSQTWANVAAQLGENAGFGVFTAGALGKEYIEWGSVTCDSGTPYTLNIKGTGTVLTGGIKFAGTKTVLFSPLVKKIGDIVQTDNPTWAGTGFGQYVGGGTTAASGTGTGAVQKIIGSVQYHINSTTAKNRHSCCRHLHRHPDLHAELLIWAWGASWVASPLRVILAAGSIGIAAFPAVSHAACTPNVSTLNLGTVANVTQLKTKLGEYTNGTYVQGTNPPIQVSFTQCAAGVTTTVSANSVSLSTSGQSVAVRAILISVNGVPLATPKDLLTTSHSFTGDSTLAIAIVPSSPFPASLVAGNYSGFLSLNFTDPT